MSGKTVKQIRKMLTSVGYDVAKRPGRILYQRAKKLYKPGDFTSAMDLLGNRVTRMPYNIPELPPPTDTSLSHSHTEQ